VETLYLINLVLLWLIVLVNFLITMTLVRRMSKQTDMPDFENMPTLPIGSAAPMFLAETLTGEEVNLDSYPGQSIAFVFMSPSCIPCVDKVPSIQNIEPKASRNGVKLILVSLADKAETQSFVEKNSVKLPIIIAPQESNPFAKDYMISGTPYFCLVNKDGKIKSSGFLGSKWDSLVAEW